MGVFEGKFPQWVYLIGYNAISTLLWSLIFTQTALTVLTRGHEDVYPAVRAWVLFTQSMALLEVLHAILGLVDGPVLTTFMQVAGRSAALWMAIEAYPSTALSPLYTSMVLAWSAADAIWACYLLYPFGILSGTVLGSTAVLQHRALEARV